jgi:hypothetical protein
MLVPMLNLFDGVLVLLRRLHRDVGRVTILTIVNVRADRHLPKSKARAGPNGLLEARHAIHLNKVDISTCLPKLFPLGWIHAREGAVYCQGVLIDASLSQFIPNEGSIVGILFVWSEHTTFYPI